MRLEEKKYMYKNIERKQKVIDEKQEYKDRAKERQRKRYEWAKELGVADLLLAEAKRTQQHRLPLTEESNRTSICESSWAGVAQSKLQDYSSLTWRNTSQRFFGSEYLEQLEKDDEEALMLEQRSPKPEQNSAFNSFIQQSNNVARAKTSMLHRQHTLQHLLHLFIRQDSSLLHTPHQNCSDISKTILQKSAHSILIHDISLQSFQI